MNSVVLIGRLTEKPELYTTNNGTGWTKFTVAVNRRFKKEGQQEADFIRCTAWNKRAELITQYFDKGHRIGIEGSIQTGSYEDQDGKKVYTTDVLVNNVDFIETKKDIENNQAQAPTNTSPSTNNAKNNASERQAESQPQPQYTQNLAQQATIEQYPEISDDDLPF